MEIELIDVLFVLGVVIGLGAMVVPIWLVSRRH